MPARLLNKCECGQALWFYRDYLAFTGGHLKVSHYFDHGLDASGWYPKIAFSNSSQLKGDPLWQSVLPYCVSCWQPKPGDILFVAGMDWQYLETMSPAVDLPIINLVQGMRHADPRHPLYRFLSKRAIRVCVSEQVKDAIVATGECNGPVYVINNGIEAPSKLPEIPSVPPSEQQWLLVGNKNVKLASALARHLRAMGVRVDLIKAALPQDAFLQRMERAAVVVCFPFEQEGFYLPALEAMARGKLVICPDCVGNRSFCRDNTVLMPIPSEQGYLHTARALLAMKLSVQQQYIERALQLSSIYTLEQERESFQFILNNAYSSW